MPRQVDHAERRAEITDAVLRIATRQGLGAVTMSQVAAEAGVSKGRVQHYFPSKRELLLQTARRLRERVQQRLVPDTSITAPREVLRALLHAMLPTTEPARQDTLAGQALFVIALNEPELRALYLRGVVEMRQAIAALVRQVTLTDDPSASEHQARLLLGLSGNLGEAVLLGELSIADAQRVVDDHLDALSGGYWRT